MCQGQGTRQKFSFCRVPGRESTRQRAMPRHPAGRPQVFAVGHTWHTAKPLSWAFRDLPCASAKEQSPVVMSSFFFLLYGEVFNYLFHPLIFVNTRVQPANLRDNLFEESLYMLHAGSNSCLKILHYKQLNFYCRHLNLQNS